MDYTTRLESVKKLLGETFTGAEYSIGDPIPWAYGWKACAVTRLSDKTEVLVAVTPSGSAIRFNVPGENKEWKSLERLVKKFEAAYFESLGNTNCRISINSLMGLED